MGLGSFMKKILAILIAAIALIAAPSAALAYSSDSPTITGTVAPGQTITVTWPAGTFNDGEPVTVGCNCTNGTPTVTPLLSSLHAGTGTATSVANPDGSFSVSITLPNVNFGTCSLLVNGVSTNTATGTLTYVPNLPDTGLNVAIYVWAGAGALVLGLAFVIVFASRRKISSNK